MERNLRKMEHNQVKLLMIIFAELYVPFII